MNLTLTFILDLIGAITFAFSGAYVAINFDMDWLGIVIMACTTACGGGLTRDIILGNIPANMFKDPTDVTVAMVVAFITIALYKPLMKSKFKEHIMFVINTLDAMGLAIFVVVGCNVAITCGHKENMFIICFCGVLTAVGGGMWRDVMVNRVPMIFSKEIYATAALPGAIIYYLSMDILGEAVATAITLIIVFGIRMWAIINKKNLPYVEKVKE